MPDRSTTHVVGLNMILLRVIQDVADENMSKICANKQYKPNTFDLEAKLLAVAAHPQFEHSIANSKGDPEKATTLVGFKCSIYDTHVLHVWNIYLHWGHLWGICWWIMWIFHNIPYMDHIPMDPNTVWEGTNHPPNYSELYQIISQTLPKKVRLDP